MNKRMRLLSNTSGYKNMNIDLNKKTILKFNSTSPIRPIAWLALAILAVGAFGNSVQAQAWIDENFSTYPAGLPPTASGRLVSVGPVVGLNGGMRMFKAAAVGSSDHRWRFSDTYDAATSRPQGYVSFKIQYNSATIASGNVLSWRLGVNTSSGQGSASNNYLDFRFSHGLTANNLVMQSPGGTSAGQVTATISTTAPVIMKIWYNKTGSAMDYTDPSGAAKTLNQNSYVAYAGDTLLNPASTGTTMATTIGVDTTVGKMAFLVGTSSACDFLIDDVYAAASAPSPTTVSIFWSSLMFLFLFG
jgi:hypothetical protein